MPATSTRQHIVEVADRLFYERGFDATSFADIAGEIGLSRGNFYYHFKTKDDILDAVIALRRTHVQAMLQAWENDAHTPLERIRRFMHMLITNQSKIMAHGCPVGTLCNELVKLNHPAQGDAAGIFTLFRNWLARQFFALGRQADADPLAMHLLMRSQGIATLAAAFHDEDFIHREIGQMDVWLKLQKPDSSPVF